MGRGERGIKLNEYFAKCCPFSVLYENQTCEGLLEYKISLRNYQAEKEGVGFPEIY